jgi:hypothetical protein
MFTRLDCLRAVATTLVVLVCTAPALAADITLQIRDGHVTLDARDASVVEILTEWSRVAQTTIVGGEKIVGPPVTIQMVDVPESAALDIVLRECAGYVATARPPESAGESIFQRIVILAASTAPATGDRVLPLLASPRPVEPRAGRRTALPPIDVTPPALPGPAFESDVPGVSQPSLATPWFPDKALSAVPGIVAPPAQNPNVVNR